MSFQREAEPSSEGACKRDTGERGGGESTATSGSVGVATNLISYRFESEKYLRWGELKMGGRGGRGGGGV